MALIRQSVAQTMARDAVVLDLGDLVRQGEQIKARARAEADRIIAEAKAERDRLISDAAAVGREQGSAKGMEEGRKQGEAAGRLAALAEFRDKLATLEKGWVAGLTAFEQERDTMLLDAKQDVLRLAATVSQMVTKRQVELKPDLVADQIGAVLSLLTRPTRIALAINPDDEALVREAMPGLCQRFAAATHVEISQDATISRGGCVARTAGGAIDATIETQLGRIVEALLPKGSTESAPQANA